MKDIIDTHAHYHDEAFDEDRDELLLSLSSCGIGTVVDVAAEAASLAQVEALTEQYGFLYGAAGLHPDEIGSLDEETEAEIRRLLRKPKIVACGEIGLDYYWNKEARELQIEGFRRQIRLAQEAGKPIMVHSREAAADTFSVIREADAWKTGGILHCYSYSLEHARIYADMGLFLGIGGVVTYKNAKKLKEVVREIPLSSLVLETDCPYLSPVPNRGKRNDSRNLPYVAAEIASLKEITAEEVIETTTANARKLLGI